MLNPITRERVPTSVGLGRQGVRIRSGYGYAVSPMTKALGSLDTGALRDAGEGHGASVVLRLC